MKTEKTVGTIKSIETATEKRVDFILTDQKGNDIKFTIGSDVLPDLKKVIVGGEVSIIYFSKKNNSGYYEVSVMTPILFWIGQ